MAIKLNDKHKRDSSYLLATAIQLYEKLDAELQVLAGMVTGVDGDLPCYVAELPFPSAEADMSHIQIQSHQYNADARPYVAEAIAQTERLDGQGPKATLRLPGLCAASDEVIRKIAEINELKADLRTVATCHPSGSPARVKLRRMIKEKLSKVVILQAYRTIEVVEGDLRKVSLTWATNTTGHLKKTVSELRDELNREIADAPDDIHPDSWEAMVKMDLKSIEGLPDDEYLAQRRNVAPHPRANVFMNDGTKDMIGAHLPIFYKDNGKDEVPLGQSMLNMDAEIRRKMRSDVKLESEPLIERLHVYRYTPMYRNYINRQSLLDDSHFDIKIVGGRKAGAEVLLSINGKIHTAREEGTAGILGLYSLITNPAGEARAFGQGSNGWKIKFSPRVRTAKKAQVTSINSQERTAIVQLDRKEVGRISKEIESKISAS